MSRREDGVEVFLSAPLGEKDPKDLFKVKLEEKAVEFKVGSCRE